MANSLVLLFLALFALSASADVSIDCGASDSYIDENFQAWMGDDDLIQTAIYVVKGSEIRVCVAQTTSNQFPFISALEVRRLDSNMYNHVDAQYALFLISRIAYGANTTIRSPDDVYDRIWVPAAIGNGLTKVTSDALLIDVNIPDDPPQAVLQNAITTSSTSESFLLYIDNKPESKTIVPPYGSVSELHISNMTASSNTSFSLVATDDSTLPPLINAIEVFLISDPLTDGTNSNDVEGLASLQSQLSLLQEWGGDPCLPASFTWDWINCSTGGRPRVTALYLSGFDLSGPLPDFSSMDALQIIDMHNNSISEEIPDFLGKFSNLKQLNLADNEFNGPTEFNTMIHWIMFTVCQATQTLCVSGKSCQTTDGTSSVTRGSRKKKKNKLPVILGSSIPSFLVFCAIFGAVAAWHHRRKTAAIASLSAGQAGSANKTNGSPQGGTMSTQMVGKMGQAVINEFKVSIEEQITSQVTNQVDEIAQNAQQQDLRNA
ncbi:hypothetical protein Patl1_30829 [Pistacia atlantica]|uniref:Uncharacterized protein n=1 Tax=Pistacia atlantica TaxID=434234 RepID=A0ACC1AAQ3_9ROSI|nr:hypothetical protein Patl1_30829 [Pistacia atlantica]